MMKLNWKKYVEKYDIYIKKELLNILKKEDDISIRKIKFLLDLKIQIPWQFIKEKLDDLEKKGLVNSVSFGEVRPTTYWKLGKKKSIQTVIFKMQEEKQKIIFDKIKEKYDSMIESEKSFLRSWKSYIHILQEIAHQQLPYEKKCMCCGKTEEIMVCHIMDIPYNFLELKKLFKILRKDEKQKLFEQYYYNPKNLIYLCGSCHSLFDSFKLTKKQKKNIREEMEKYYGSNILRQLYNELRKINSFGASMKIYHKIYRKLK